MDELLLELPDVLPLDAEEAIAVAEDVEGAAAVPPVCVGFSSVAVVPWAVNEDAVPTVFAAAIALGIDVMCFLPLGTAV